MYPSCNVQDLRDGREWVSRPDILQIVAYGWDQRICDNRTDQHWNQKRSSLFHTPESDVWSLPMYSFSHSGCLEN